MRLLAASVLFVAAAASAQLQLPPGTSSSVDSGQQQQRPAQNPAQTKAEDAIAAGNYDEAVKLLAPLAQDAETNGRVFYDLGFAQDALGHDADAVTAYRAAIARNASDVAARVSLGLLLARGGDRGAAEVQLRAAVAVAGAEPLLTSRANRALAEMDAETKPEQARQELVAALRVSAETVDDALLAAEIAEALHDDDDAMKAYQRAQQISPQSPEAALGYARALARAGKFLEAEVALQPALKAHPANHELLAELASEYILAGKVDQALPLLAELRKADPDNTAVALLQARALAASGKADEADDIYKQLIAAHPDDPTLLAEEGDNLIRQKRSAEAEPLLLRALEHPERFPNKKALADAAGELAFAASSAHHPETVLKALATRSAILPPNAPYTFLAATAYDSLRRNKEAAEQYRLFLSQAGGNFPDQEWQAKQRLQILTRNR